LDLKATEFSRVLRHIVQVNINAWLTPTSLGFALPVTSLVVLIVTKFTIIAIRASVPWKEAAPLALARVVLL